MAGEEDWLPPHLVAEPTPPLRGTPPKRGCSAPSPLEGEGWGEGEALIETLASQERFPNLAARHV